MIHQFRIFPIAASAMASEIDLIFWSLVILCGSITLFVFFLIICFVVRYYHAPIHEKVTKEKVQLRIELTWVIIPMFLFLAIFSWASYVYFEMHVAPQNSTEVYVLGKQWMWKFQHANGVREINTLHVPVNQPIKLVMSSEDVIHSFFIPVFRMKQDVVPGRYSYAWFQADQTGEFHILCTQYCGSFHASMRGKVVVLSREAFQLWQASQLESLPKLGTLGMAERGKELFNHLGCVNCHGPPYGVKAPDLRGLYMKEVKLTTGETVVADKNYMRESILNPRAKIVSEYGSTMPSFQGSVSEEGLLQLIEYIKSLSPPEAKP